MKLTSTSWKNGDRIPTRYAAGKPGSDGPTMSDNVNPQFAWSEVPEGTQSFALICHDGDVPSKGDDVNQEGREIPATLPRIDFFHWLLVDIPPSLGGFAEGEWWVQDLAASLPARLLGTGPGEAVLDLCAAPGGKTMQLAAAGWNVTAVDVSKSRLARLSEAPVLGGRSWPPALRLPPPIRSATLVCPAGSITTPASSPPRAGRARPRRGAGSWGWWRVGRAGCRS